MRILLDYRPALRHRTGVGGYAHSLATAIQGLLPPSDTLTLFSSSWKDRLPADAVPGAQRVDARVPVRVLNYAWHRLEWPAVEWMAGAVDVTHSLHPLMMPTRSGARVITIHDLFFLDHRGQTSAEIRRDYAALAADHARRADAVVVVSEYTRDLVIDRLKLERDRVTLCYPGAPDWTPRAEPPAPGPILFLGTLEPRKNLPGLLKAYAALVDSSPDVPELVVAGHQPAEHREQAAALVRAHAHLGDRVRFTGYISDEERLRLYREASMLVIPSFDEGFGLPALEAMTIGLPVVATRRGSLPEVLGDTALFSGPEDYAEMAAAMRRILADAATRMRMVAAGIARARTFRWETGAARVYEAYSTAIDRRRRRS